MKTVPTLLAAVLTALAPLVFADSHPEWTGNIHFSLGGKHLDDSWYPVEDQGELGIDVAFRKRYWPVHLVVALYGSGNERETWYDRIEGNTGELRLGLRKVWSPDPIMHPYLGGGLARVSARWEEADVLHYSKDDDSATGIWLSGGVFWTIREVFNIGVEVGISGAEVELYGDDVKAGGGHSGLVLGYHW